MRRLTGLLEGLGRPNNRGRPLTPIQQVCIALNFYGGGHLTRIAGLCGGVSQKAAWCAVRRVTMSICRQKPNYIQFPSDAECAAAARRMEDRFHLPGFAFGVDGVIVKFEEAPREVPVGTVKQDFWGRKQTYCINCQVVGNDEGRILDICADWQGANTDARIWNSSPVKAVIHRQSQFLVAGDSGYPISPVCITPFRVAEAQHDLRKRLFNRRHSGLRTVCTENIFGVVKRRWRCLKLLRSKHKWARETVIACMILHNIGLLWADEGPEDEEDMPPPPVPAVPAAAMEQEELEPADVRARGQMVRERLLLRMPR